MKGQNPNKCIKIEEKWVVLLKYLENHKSITPKQGANVLEAEPQAQIRWVFGWYLYQGREILQNVQNRYKNSDSLIGILTQECS